MKIALSASLSDAVRLLGRPDRLQIEELRILLVQRKEDEPCLGRVWATARFGDMTAPAPLSSDTLGPPSLESAPRPSLPALAFWPYLRDWR